VRPGARRRPQWRIDRIGWKDAKKLIERDGYSLLKLDDGHAELLAPADEKPGAKYRITTGSEAYYYLTKRSVEKLEEACSLPSPPKENS
jgi:hypothetical protein